MTRGISQRTFLYVILVILAACSGRTSEAPRAGDFRGSVPDLSGIEVLVLPVQRTAGLRGGSAPDPDAELAHALQGEGPEVRWILPSDIRASLDASPGIRADIDHLDVGVFLRAEVERVGDPLFGELRRLAALTDGATALIPVEVRHRAETEDDASAVEFVTALLDARSGRVLWFGVVDGGEGDPDDPAAMASAAEALARALVR